MIRVVQGLYTLNSKAFTLAWSVTLCSSWSRNQSSPSYVARRYIPKHIPVHSLPYRHQNFYKVYVCNDLWNLVSKRFEYKRSSNRGLLISFVFENWCRVTAKFIHSFRKLDVIFEKTQKPCRSCNLASYSYGQGPSIFFKFFSNNKLCKNYHFRPKLLKNLFYFV